MWDAIISPNKTAILVTLASERYTQCAISPHCNAAPVAVPEHCMLACPLSACTQLGTVSYGLCVVIHKIFALKSSVQCALKVITSREES